MNSETAAHKTTQRVFLSHSMTEQPLVRSAMLWLQSSPLRSAEVEDPATWNVSSLEPRKVIREKIGQADAVLLIWSDAAPESAWVNYEIGMAQALDVPIFVLLAGGAPSKLPADLAGHQVGNLDPVAS